MTLHETYLQKWMIVKDDGSWKSISVEVGKKYCRIFEEDKTSSFSFIIFPKPKIRVKINRLQHSKSLPLITSIHLPMINTIQLMHSFTENPQILNNFRCLQFTINFSLFLIDSRCWFLFFLVNHLVINIWQILNKTYYVDNLIYAIC